MKIREEIEQREEAMLSPFATLSKNSQGREIAEEADDVRTCFMRDRDRIIHSKAFRRLKHKTQVYISPGNDHYRTRLTHTLEVAQIARTIGRALNLNEDLIEAIALAHDVGHTPFAHTGEEVLNELSPHGFKHNQNSVRVLTYIEQRRNKHGLNLSWEVLDGVLHHSGYGKNKKCAQTLEGQIIRFSDKIAYVQHDIDDSIRGGLITEADLPQQYTALLGHSHSQRIAVLVNDLINESKRQMEQAQPNDSIVFAFSKEIDEALQGLRQFMFDTIYHGSVCAKEREQASFVVKYLYEYYLKAPEKMPENYYRIACEEDVDQGVVDYISGMSDNYCVELFKELALPRSFLTAN